MQVFRNILEVPEHLSWEVGTNCSPLLYFVLVGAMLSRKPSRKFRAVFANCTVRVHFDSY